MPTSANCIEINPTMHKDEPWKQIARWPNWDHHHHHDEQALLRGMSIKLDTAHGSSTWRSLFKSGLETLDEER
jgi:hypothetical protein